jgi:hypothetical protein
MSGTNKLDPFVLEVFFAKYEFVAQHLLCCSDGESISMKELLALADEEALALWDNLSLGYTECRGLPQLRAEIAKDFPGLDPECTLTFAGAEEGIYCTFKTLLEPSDHAIVVTPCYQSLKSIPDSLCTTSSLDLHTDDWSLDLTLMRALIRPNTKLIVVNFPHNPTGTIITLEKQKELILLAREFGLWLFCDEVSSYHPIIPIILSYLSYYHLIILPYYHTYYTYHTYLGLPRCRARPSPHTAHHRLRVREGHLPRRCVEGLRLGRIASRYQNNSHNYTE